MRAGRNDLVSQLGPGLNQLVSLLLALSLLLLPGSADQGKVWALPGRSPHLAGATDLPLAASAPAGLQEVAPPLAVQQLQEALAGREPRVEILAPANDALLPPGPWTLQLRVHDWPLVDGGPLGLGPHLVVQLDDEVPLRLTGTEVGLPALAPGSHRLTVFAARPWGEAAKNPGAWSQIRLHRAAPNPLALPTPGQVQLIAVSPAATAAVEPLLLDWLLLDAPLQNLRSADGRWRLRVTINGAGFVIDRQTPLWLKGWQPGRNAIQLELLDVRGEPLTPPFNSLVREVELDRTNREARWQQGPLSAGELAILLGEAPAQPAASPPGAMQGAATPAPAGAGPATTSPTPQPGTASAAFSPAADPAPANQIQSNSDPAGQPAQPEEPTAAAPPSTPPHPGRAAAYSEPASVEGPASSEPAAKSEAAADPGLPEPPPSSPWPATEIPAGQPAARLPGSATPAAATPIPLADESGAGQEPAASPAAGPESRAAPPPSPRPESLSLPPVGPEAIPPASSRLRPGSSLGGSAREQVNPDGTMIRPPRRGPLAGLRERLLP